ncbi:hypothetical protein GCM10009837_67020 [Streptomyces durmitorensis]|uniref:Secreted protein n=1 Tax=Streptomyces durmitorensis TaxID=319947 RepID=A0ABY4Q643_9ACTN|nr:hypothetical protein [Streptomyces durmitorensis]UQT61192.1 hypothetical protein M4V62_42375 [Streptomyces durmitorensis]
MKLKLASLGATAVMLVGGGLAAGAAAPAVADSQAAQASLEKERVLVASSGDFTAQGTWSKATSWGESEGNIYSTYAGGWVKDLTADGYCAQVVIEWYGTNGKKDTDYSPEACPKGDKDDFSKKPGDSTHWTATGWAVYMQRV